MQTLLVLTRLSILLAVLLVYPLDTTGNSTAADFLDDKEKLVQTIGNFALQNYQNSSALAETCGTSSTCSRRVCQPLLSDLPGLICVNVPQTFDCEGPNISTCTRTLVTRKEGYVRWAPDANPEDPTCDMKSTICSQRELDRQIFIEKGTSSDFRLQAWLYFGASNGIDRIYPGKELNDSACNKYDIRERPWYKGATAVLKEIVVMLDGGPSLGQPLGLWTGSAQTLFDASRNITLRLLNTLSKDDRISVFTFGSTSSPSAPTTVGRKVTVSDSSLDSESNNPVGLESLKTAIRMLPNPDSTVNQIANLTAALVAARDQFNNQSSNQLKIVIIITAGDLVGQEDLQPDLVNSVVASNVTIFTYRLLQTNLSGQITGNDGVTSKLKNASCSLNGSYEEGLYDAQNPLGTVQSFYSYVAKLRFEENGQRPYWVPRHSTYSGIGEIISVAYPVFSGNFLLGVAGVDVVVDNLDDISSEVVALLANRNSLRSLDVADHPKNFNCTQTPLPGDSSCPAALKANPGITGFCNNTDDNPNKEQKFKDRVCCQSCESGESHSLSKAGKIGVIIGAVLGGTLIVAGLFGWCIYSKIVAKEDSIPEGDEQGRRPLDITNRQSPTNTQEHLQSVRAEHYYDTLAL